MIVAIPKETAELEKRVSIIPEIAGKLIQKGLELRVESDAGLASNFLDAQYAEAGATIVKDRTALFSEADLVLAVQTPSQTDLDHMKKNSILVCFIWALQNAELVETLKTKGITALAMDAIPRISRAQNMMHCHQ